MANTSDLETRLRLAQAKCDSLDDDIANVEEVLKAKKALYEQLVNGDGTSEDLGMTTGWLTKEGGKGWKSNWKKRFFVLKGDVLSYYSDTRLTDLKGSVCLHQGEARDGYHGKGKKSSVPHVFTLCLPHRTLPMIAATEEEKQRWIDTLTSAIAESSPVKNTLEGWVRKKSKYKKEMKRRYLVLRNQMLYWYENDQLKDLLNNMSTVEGVITTNAATPNTFTFATPQRSVVFSCDSEEDFSSWCTALQSVAAQRSSVVLHKELLNAPSRAGAEEYKVLLLGTAGSGKSTLLKQVQIIHTLGFTEDMCRQYVPTIIGNIVFSVKRMLVHLKRAGEATPPALDALRYTTTELNEELWDEISDFLDSPLVSRAVAAGTVDMGDNVAYFHTHLGRVRQPDYVPIPDDVLHAYESGAEVTEVRYQRKNEGRVCTIKYIGTNGQRNERRKWKMYWRNTIGVVFMVNLGEYDRTLREDANQNRLKESLLVWGDICQEEAVQNVPLVLLFNKLDLFEEKLKTTPLTVCFEEYDGGEGVERAFGFIRDKFIKLCNQQTLSDHRLVAVDTDKVRFTERVICDHLLSSKREA